MTKETSQQRNSREAKAWFAALAARADEARQHVVMLSARDDVADSMAAVLRIAESGVFDVLGALRLVATLGIVGATAKADEVAIDNFYAKNEELHRLMLWFERVVRNPENPGDDRTPDEIGADRTTAIGLFQSILAGSMGPDEIEFVRGLVGAIYAAGASDRAPKKHRAEAVLRATALGGKRHVHDEFLREVDRVTQSFQAFGDADRTEMSGTEATALAIRHVLADKDFVNTDDGTIDEEVAKREVARARARDKPQTS